MRRLVVASTLVLTLALPAAVSAHPSENRNLNGFGGNVAFPHCHTNQQSGHLAFPSHLAHVATNGALGSGAIFMAATCP